MSVSKWVGWVGLSVFAGLLGGCDEAAGGAGDTGDAAAQTGEDSGAEVPTGDGGTDTDTDAGSKDEDAAAQTDAEADDAGVDAEAETDAAEPQQDAGTGGTGGAIADGMWGTTFDADGTHVEALFDAATGANGGYAIPITGLGDERYLQLGGAGVVADGARLRMIPIDTTGTFRCGEGPSAYRLVEMTARVADQNYLANVDQGSCSIEVTAVGAAYVGTFSASLPPDGDPSGTPIVITGGAFRNDGSEL